jgi:hypothetical protein
MIFCYATFLKNFLRSFLFSFSLFESVYFFKKYRRMNQTKKIERANSISGTAPSASPSTISSSKSPRLQAIDQRRKARLSFEKDDEDSILSRRKVSLMPLVTEEDLKKNTDLGRKDPEGIAQVFGDDVASRFRYPSTPSSAISPPPYDTKDKMVLRKISPLITPPLPHENRDLHVPRFLKKFFSFHFSFSFFLI